MLAPVSIFIVVDAVDAVDVVDVVDVISGDLLRFIEIY